MVASNIKKIKSVLLLAFVQTITIIIFDLFFKWLYWGIDATTEAPKWSIQDWLSQLQINSYVFISTSIAVLFYIIQFVILRKRQTINFVYMCLFSLISSMVCFILFLTRITESRIILILAMVVLALLSTEGISFALSSVMNKKNNFK